MSLRETFEVVENDAIALMVTDVIAMGTGPEPTGTIEITENGVFDVASYALADVDVPQGVFPTGTIPITSNGTVDVTNYASADVNVPQGIFPTGTIPITSNGTFDVTNYASADVSIDIASLRVTPRAENFQQGYLSLSGTTFYWNYYAAATDVSDEYYLQAGHVYVMFNGTNRGNRWNGAIFANSVYDNITSSQSSIQWIGAAFADYNRHAEGFVANQDSYLLIQKSSENDLTLKSYLIDVTNVS